MQAARNVPSLLQLSTISSTRLQDHPLCYHCGRRPLESHCTSPNTPSLPQTLLDHAFSSSLALHTRQLHAILLLPYQRNLLLCDPSIATPALAQPPHTAYSTINRDPGHPLSRCLHTTRRLPGIVPLQRQRMGQCDILPAGIWKPTHCALV